MKDCKLYPSLSGEGRIIRKSSSMLRFIIRRVSKRSKGAVTGILSFVMRFSKVQAEESRHGRIVVREVLLH